MNTASELLVSVERLKRDIADAAKTMSDDEARFLVDAYYIMQDDRKRFHNQLRALSESAEPNKVIEWLGTQSEVLENQIRRALDKYTSAHIMGSWMREIHGIGPVISAGLLAHIDMQKAPTCGHIFAFAGLDPTKTWNKGERRPWNAALKTLCWKAGQSFMKFSNDDKCFYGHLYRQRKQQEIARNLTGLNYQTAVALQEKFKGSTSESAKWYFGNYHLDDVEDMISAGKDLTPENLKAIYRKDKSGTPMLPPAQIDARARRFAVKIFLSHLHAEWYRRMFKKEPPRPYAIDILKHAHMIEPRG